MNFYRLGLTKPTHSLISDELVQGLVPIYEDTGLKSEVARFTIVNKVIDVGEGPTLSTELYGTVIFEDAHQSEIHVAGESSLGSPESNDLPIVGGTGHYVGASGYAKFKGVGGDVIEFDLCLL